MKRRLNLWLVAGLVTVLVAFVSYYGWLVRFPAMRDVPWLSLLVFAAGLLLLGAGLRRAFCQPQLYRGRIAGPILALLSVAIFSFFVYDSFYYSRQIPAATGAPQANQKAPEFTLPDSNGAPVALSNLVGAQRWTLLVFYRGFWWVFCNSELRSLEKHRGEFASRGVRVVAISVDPPEVTREHARKMGYTHLFLADTQRDVIRRYDLVHPGGGPGGDIARPASFLLDSTGTVRWVDLTDDYRVRPRPPDILRVVDSLAPH